MGLTSLPFLYGFLPAVVIASSLISKFSKKLCIFFVLSISIVFFVYVDNALSLPFIIVSLLGNYLLGHFLSPSGKTELQRQLLFIVGIAVNILLLVCFKYVPAVIGSIPQTDTSTLQETTRLSVIAPIALSYITFSQISYLIELFRGKINQPKFHEYGLYIIFFPKLIAGPITRASTFFEQLQTQIGMLNAEGFLRGMSFISVGLFKKVIIADQLSFFVNPVFDAATKLEHLDFYRVWFGAVSYGFQLYFDFSGYSDIAIGVALLLGFTLPINFDAPYRAVNITEFWRKWHISLGTFFRENVYFPLGGNRKGYFRKMLNLLFVMILVGIWHGVGLTFLIWGALHGLFLVAHNVWLSFKSRVLKNQRSSWIGRFLGWLLTFVVVTIAWIPFRASNVATAWRLIGDMMTLPTRVPIQQELYLASATILLPFLVILLLPTTQKWLVHEENLCLADASAQSSKSPWGFFRGVITGTMAVCAIIFLTQGSEFIYKNF